MSPLLSNNPKLYRVKAWTGPTVVKAMADKIRQSGGVDVLEGTETVYWTCSGDTPEHVVFRALENIKRVHNTGFGLRVDFLREA